MTENKIIAGAKKGGSGRTPVEAPDSLRSIALARVLDLVSEGEILGLANGMESIFLDETPLANADGSLNFKNVQVEFRSGTQDQEYIPGFPSVENEVGVNVELKHGTPWVRNISRTELSAISIRLSVPALQKTNKDNGDTNGHTITYTIQVATDGGEYETALNHRFSGKTTSKYEQQHRIDLPPTESGWLIRVIRNTPNENSSTVADLTFIESYVEIIDAKLRYPNSAIVGLAVDAEQFQSVPTRAYDLFGRIVRVPSNYDPITRTYTGSWDGTFKPSWTDNPAWIFYDILLNTRFGLGHLVDASMVDKWNLYKIGRYCDELVPDGNGGMEPRFSCNVYYQTRTDAYKVVRDLASAFRALTFWAGGQVRTVADMPEDPVYIYNGSNVIGGKFVYQGSRRKQRHTVALVSWNDMSDFGRAKVEYVEDVDGIARYGIQPIEVMAIGCTSRSQANRLGRWILFTERHETNSVTFEVGLDGSVAAPGQIIVIADPARAGRRIGGRISDATNNSITVDKIPTRISIGDRVRVVMPDATVQTRTVQAISGNRISVTADFDSIPQRQSVWALESSDLATQRYRVMSVEENDGIGYTINAVEHAEGKFDEIEHGIKWDPPNTTALPPKVQHGPTNVTVDFRDIAGEITAGTAITISWDAVPGAIKYEIEWRQGEGSWVWGGETTGTTYDIYDAQPGPFEVRITAINATGMKSNPIRTEPVEIPDTVLKPRVIQRLEESADELSRRIAKEELDRMAGDTKEAQDRAAAIKTEAERIAEEMGALADELDEESAARVAAIDQVASDLTKEVTERTKHVTETVASETEARTAAIKVVADALAQEVTDRTDAVNTAAGELRGAVDAIAARINDITEADEHDPAKDYPLGDFVQSAGKLYKALKNVPVGVAITDTSYWELVGNYTSIGDVVTSTASRINVHETQIGSIDGKHEALSQTVSGHATRIADAERGVTANANNLSEAITRILATEQGVDALSRDLTSLGAVVEGKASTDALNALSSRVQTTENAIDAQSRQLTSLNTTLGDLRADTAPVFYQAEEPQITGVRRNLVSETWRSVTGITAAGGLSDPLGGSRATELAISEGADGSYEYSYLLESLPAEAGTYSAAIYVRAGTVDGLTLGIYSVGVGGSAWAGNAAEIVQGPGTLGSVAPFKVSGLSPDEWTLIRFKKELDQDAHLNFYVYPRHTTGQLIGDTVHVFGAQIELGTSPTSYQAVRSPTDFDGSGLPVGSIWYDTGNGNRPHRYNGSTWDPIDDTRVGAQASAIEDLSSRVTQTEAGVASHSSSLTSLDNRLDTAETGLAGVVQTTRVNSEAIAGLDSRIASNEEGIESVQSSVVSLSGRIESTESDVSGLQAGVEAATEAVSGLSSRVSATEGSVSSVSGEVTSLRNTINNGTTGLASKASAAAVSDLSNRVEQTEGAISSQSASVTALENAINHPSTGLGTKASASALQTLTNQVNHSTTGLATKAASSAVTALQNQINNATTGLPSKASSSALSVLESRVSEVESTAFETTHLVSRVDTIESALVHEMITSANQNSALNSSVNVLSGKMETAEGKILANANAVSGLTTRMTNAEGKVESQGSHLTRLQSQVNALDLDAGGAGSAISELDTRVTSAEGKLVSQGNAITALQNSVTSANKTFIQPGQPSTTGRTNGDLWIDTDDSNKLYGFLNGKWELRQDSGKNTIFVQGTQPVAKAVNDLWFDTARNNRQFRWNGSAWVEITDTRVAANASAITGLTNRVTSIEGVNTTQSQQITTLQNTVNNSTRGVTATANGLAALTTRVTDAEGSISSHTTDITQLKNTVNHSTTGVTATSNALNALTSRVTAAEGVNTSQGSAITALKNTVNNSTTGVTATANALSALTTRVSNAETSVSSHGSAITSLQNTVNNSKTGVTATASALSALTTRVSTAEGKVNSHASSISSLSTTVGSHTTTITSHSSSINGLQGKAGVTIDANGYLTGWALHNNGKSGTMTVVADRFRIVTPGQTARTPFSLTSSVLQLNTDLQMGGGVLWNKGATHSAILGPAGSSGEFLFWAGKNPTSAAAATKTNAAMYVDKNGAAAFSGTLHSSLLSASAMELNSMRIHSGGGRLCPFTIEDFAYRGLGTGNTSMTLNLTGFKAPNNGSAGFDAKRFAAHKMDVIMEANLNGDRGWETVRFQVQYNGGAWENLASLRVNCNYRGGATLISRYTTKTSWSTVNFRCVTNEGNTQTLAFRISVKNYYESSNGSHSYTGADASNGGGGSAPPPGGGFNPRDPNEQIVLP